jgi:myo-inositol-1(or 4)-monophosphatase
MIAMHTYSSFLQNILEQASWIAGQNFGKVSGYNKSADNNQVLTDTDIEIGKVIIAAIQETYPSHNIIDEEAGVIDKGSQFTWVVDPIDGTSNFANGVPTYGTMVGLLDGATPIAGGLGLPSFQEIFLAEKGQGATCNGEKVRVSEEQTLLKCLVAYGIDGHQEDPQYTFDECHQLAQLVLGIRNLRSSNSVFDITMLAKGKYGAALNRTSKIWDNVAQQILVEEAGGIYTDFTGQPMDYSSPLSRAEQNFTYCAASPALHAQVQALLQK